MFVCHGNICRSPMGEYLLKDMVKKAGKDGQYEIASSAVSAEEIWGEIGNPVYGPVKRLLLGLGINCDEKRATQLRYEDGDKYDIFLCMDDSNLVKAKRILGEKQSHSGRSFHIRNDGGRRRPWSLHRSSAYRTYFIYFF